MKPARLHDQGFTLIELMFAVAVGALMMAALVAAAVCLHRSFTAVDNFFASHVQQVRIMDYLSRDVKRSYIVTTSTDLQTVTCIIPNYLVDNGGNQPTRATRRGARTADGGWRYRVPDQAIRHRRAARRSRRDPEAPGLGLVRALGLSNPLVFRP